MERPRETRRVHWDDVSVNYNNLVMQLGNKTTDCVLQPQELLLKKNYIDIKGFITALGGRNTIMNIINESLYKNIHFKKYYYSISRSEEAMECEEDEDCILDTNLVHTILREHRLMQSNVAGLKKIYNENIPNDMKRRYKIICRDAKYIMNTINKLNMTTKIRLSPISKGNMIITSPPIMDLGMIHYGNAIKNITHNARQMGILYSKGKHPNRDSDIVKKIKDKNILYIKQFNKQYVPHLKERLLPSKTKKPVVSHENKTLKYERSLFDEIDRIKNIELAKGTVKDQIQGNASMLKKDLIPRKIDCGWRLRAVIDETLDPDAVCLSSYLIPFIKDYKFPMSLLVKRDPSLLAVIRINKITYYSGNCIKVSAAICNILHLDFDGDLLMIWLVNDTNTYIETILKHSPKHNITACFNKLMISFDIFQIMNAYTLTDEILKYSKYPNLIKSILISSNEHKLNKNHLHHIMLSIVQIYGDNEAYNFMIFVSDLIKRYHNPFILNGERDDPVLDIMIDSGSKGSRLILDSLYNIPFQSSSARVSANYKYANNFIHSNQAIRMGHDKNKQVYFNVANLYVVDIDYQLKLCNVSRKLYSEHTEISDTDALNFKVNIATMIPVDVVMSNSTIKYINYYHTASLFTFDLHAFVTIYSDYIKPKSKNSITESTNIFSFLDMDKIQHPIDTFNKDCFINKKELIINYVVCNSIECMDQKRVIWFLTLHNKFITCYTDILAFHLYLRGLAKCKIKIINVLDEEGVRIILHSFYNNKYIEPGSCPGMQLQQIAGGAIQQCNLDVKHIDVFETNSDDTDSDAGMDNMKIRLKDICANCNNKYNDLLSTTKNDNNSGHNVVTIHLSKIMDKYLQTHYDKMRQQLLNIKTKHVTVYGIHLEGSVKLCIKYINWIIKSCICNINLVMSINMNNIVNCVDESTICVVDIKLIVKRTNEQVIQSISNYSQMCECVVLRGLNIRLEYTNDLVVLNIMDVPTACKSLTRYIYCTQENVVRFCFTKTQHEYAIALYSLIANNMILFGSYNISRNSMEKKHFNVGLFHSIINEGGFKHCMDYVNKTNKQIGTQEKSTTSDMFCIDTPYMCLYTGAVIDPASIIGSCYTRHMNILNFTPNVINTVKNIYNRNKNLYINNNTNNEEYRSGLKNSLLLYKSIYGKIFNTKFKEIDNTCKTVVGYLIPIQADKGVGVLCVCISNLQYPQLVLVSSPLLNRVPFCKLFMFQIKVIKLYIEEGIYIYMLQTLLDVYTSRKRSDMYKQLFYNSCEYRALYEINDEADDHISYGVDLCKIEFLYHEHLFADITDKMSVSELVNTISESWLLFAKDSTERHDISDDDYNTIYNMHKTLGTYRTKHCLSNYGIFVKTFVCKDYTFCKMYNTNGSILDCVVSTNMLNVNSVISGVSVCSYKYITIINMNNVNYIYNIYKTTTILLEMLK